MTRPELNIKAKVRRAKMLHQNKVLGLSRNELARLYQCSLQNIDQQLEKAKEDVEEETKQKKG